jgi:hypothetical protein
VIGQSTVRIPIQKYKLVWWFPTEVCRKMYIIIFSTFGSMHIAVFAGYLAVLSIGIDKANISPSVSSEILYSKIGEKRR